VTMKALGKGATRKKKSESANLNVDQHAPILPPFVRDFWFRFDPATFFRIRRVLSQMLVKHTVAVQTQYTVAIVPCISSYVSSKKLFIINLGRWIIISITKVDYSTNSQLISDL
jgi:hypothetical protein